MGFFPKIYFYENPKNYVQLIAGQGWKWKENNIKKFLAKQDSKLIEYAHHESHVAYGYYIPIRCPNSSSDSIGEFETFTIWHGHGNKLEKKYTQSYPTDRFILFSNDPKSWS